MKKTIQSQRKRSITISRRKIFNSTTILPMRAKKIKMPTRRAFLVMNLNQNLEASTILKQRRLKKIKKLLRKEIGGHSTKILSKLVGRKSKSLKSTLSKRRSSVFAVTVLS